ncbi:MAG: hypothetical protein K8T25_02110 [Planctomycetia bacterium]|nr:hypothetical protein [Planctomycetia bacterium]
MTRSTELTSRIWLAALTIVGLALLAPAFAETPAGAPMAPAVAAPVATPASAAPAAAAPAPAANETLRDFIKRSQGRYAYGLYVQDKKIGWSVDETRLGEYRSQPVAITEAEGRVEMLVRGEKSVYGWHERTYYELSGEGPVLRIENSTTEDTRVSTTTAEREGQGMAVRTVAAGHETKRRTPLPKESLELIRRLDRWITTVDKQGEKFKTFSTSLDSADIDKAETYVFLSRRPFTWKGVATQLTRVRLDSDGAGYEMELLPDGTAIKGKLGPFDMRLEEEATAKNLQASVTDMTFEVQLDRPLGDPRRVNSLTLECRDLGEFHFPETPWQQSVKQADGTTVVTIRRGKLLEKGTPLSDAERALMLRATPTIQSDEPEVRKLAAKIVGRETDPLKKSVLLQHWVFEHLRKTYQANAATTLEVLASLAGDCTEHSLLFVSLARAAGVPAREVGGLVDDESVAPAGNRQGGALGWHAWAEIHDGRQWITIDPTWDETFVDATHIMLSVGTEDFAWLNVLGKMRVKVLKINDRPPAAAAEPAPRRGLRGRRA